MSTTYVGETRLGPPFPPHCPFVMTLFAVSIVALALGALTPSLTHRTSHSMLSPAVWSLYDGYGS